MEYSEQFKNLIIDSRWKGQFVGVGNPNAKILIVGKEWAIGKDSVLYNKTYSQNRVDWQHNIECCIGFEDLKEWTKDEEIIPKYNPLLPFFKQRYIHLRTLKNGKMNGGTSSTWFNYQKMFNSYRLSHGIQANTEYIDFFKDCFTTELSDVNRKNNQVLTLEERDATRQSIEHRYDLIRSTPYFQNQFDTVILACGGYADELDKRLMFGNAKIIDRNPLTGGKLPQLSFAISNELLNAIAKQLSF